jgi:hypothetical protein
VQGCGQVARSWPTPVRRILRIFNVLEALGVASPKFETRHSPQNPFDTAGFRCLSILRQAGERVIVHDERQDHEAGNLGSLARNLSIILSEAANTYSLPSFSLLRKPFDASCIKSVLAVW